MKKISRTSWIAIIAVLFAALTALIWFNAERGLMYARLNSPIQKSWAAVQLSDGEILYGHLAGITDSTIGLNDVFTLDKITPIDPNSVATSGSFSISELTGVQSTGRLVPLKSSQTLFINRAAVVYWKFVDENDPAYPYLQ